MRGFCALQILCIMWYMSSALTNTSSKSILNAWNKPATLTLVQFALVSSYCVISTWVAAAFPALRNTITVLRHPIHRPSRHVLTTTIPLAVFQIAGHLLSSTATAKIPVSLVHTIKGLSPLFTVLAYRLLYDIRYPTATYLSLIPLTGGVMLACSGKHGFGGELLGVLYALLAAIVFVTQNIFSKKLFNEAAQAEKLSPTPDREPRKLDKLNLLCYSSGLAFLMTLPIWFWSEGVGVMRDMVRDGTIILNNGPDALDHSSLLVEFLFNGTFHWGQNMLAFILLSMVSPVTYSVAGLIKRVWVIVLAIIWFRSPTTTLQAIGIGLTFLGLYLYDRSSESNKADRKARLMSELTRNGSVLPVATSRIPPISRSEHGTVGAVGGGGSGGGGGGGAVMSGGSADNVFASLMGVDDKKSDDAGRSMSGSQITTWLPPGTKQEDTWRLAERQAVGV